MRRYFLHAKIVLSYVIPIAGNQLLNILSTIIPMFFLSQVNKYELAAGALASASFVTFLTLGRNFFNATGVLVSYRLGFGADEAQYEVGVIYRNSVLLGLIIGVLCCIVMWNMSALLTVLGQSAKLVTLTKTYFHYAGLGLLIMMVTYPSSQLYTAIGHPNVNFWIAACRCPVTIFISYIFIYGSWSLPQMGLGGIMFAILLTQVPVSLIIIIMTFCSKYNGQFKLYDHARWLDFSIIKQLVKVGLPISFQSSTEMIGVTLMLYMMGWYGTDALAASQIVNQYVIVLIVFYLGCSQSLSILVSRAYAEKKWDLIKEYALSAIGLMTCLQLVIAVVFVYFWQPLTELFLNSDHGYHHDHILSLAHDFFLIAIVMNYCDGLRYIITGAYRGLHNAKTPMIVGVIGICVIGLVSSYVMSGWFGWGPIGVRLGLTVGILVAAAYLLILFFNRKMDQFA